MLLSLVASVVITVPFCALAGWLINRPEKRYA